MTNGRLLLVVGASGSGKDSVIEWARAGLVARGEGRVRIARRTITRPVKPHGEQHLEVSAAQFARLNESGEFALCWTANGRAYGIGVEIVEWLEAGLTVVVNGSRANVPEAIARFPLAEVVLIRATEATRRQRLLARQRESLDEIEARIRRADTVTLPPGVRPTEIWNDTELEHAGARLLDRLLARPIVPAQTL